MLKRDKKITLTDLINHPNEAIVRFRHRAKLIHRWTSLNADKMFYVIRPKNGDGFFANFMFVLDHLIIACEENAIPVVDMENYPTLYREDNAINGTKNVWEYYFKQLSNYTLEEVYKSRNVFLSSQLYPEYKALYYNNEKRVVPEKSKIITLYEYTKRYIHVKQHILEKAERFYNDFFSFDKIIGIHIRGTDMYTEGGHHPVPNDILKNISYIKKIMKENAIDGIFICTDEQKNIELFQKEFGKSCVYTNSLRATKNGSTGIHRDTSIGENRDNNRYLLGEEVLIDMLLLSKCDYLLCGPSNVAFAAMIFNGGKYDEIFYW